MKYPYGYYIYAYLREDGTPYYIGKGKGRRAYKKSGHLIHGIFVPSKDRIVIMESDLTELGAAALERRYIRWYGRKNNNTGILHNKNDGGDGNIGIVVSEETKRILSEKHRGVKKSDGHKKKISVAHSMVWKVTFPSGETKTIKNLWGFCKDNSLNAAHLYGTAYGKRKHHKGYKATLVRN